MRERAREAVKWLLNLSFLNFYANHLAVAGRGIVSYRKHLTVSPVKRMFRCPLPGSRKHLCLIIFGKIECAGKNSVK